MASFIIISISFSEASAFSLQMTAHTGTAHTACVTGAGVDGAGVQARTVHGALLLREPVDPRAQPVERLLLRRDLLGQLRVVGGLLSAQAWRDMAGRRGGDARESAANGHDRPPRELARLTGRAPRAQQAATSPCLPVGSARRRRPQPLRPSLRRTTTRPSRTSTVMRASDSHRP